MLQHCVESIDIFAHFVYTIDVRKARNALLVKGAIINGTCKDNLEGTDHYSC